MAARTAGIEVGIVDVPGVGVFRKMDMAGHSWAFTSNEYFIGKRTSISLVLFDLSKTDEEVENDLFHYLGSLRARETKCGFLRYRPEVVLVATHADKMDIDPQTRAKFYFRMALDNFQAFMNFYPKVMVLDCTDPRSNEFAALRECLKELRDKIIQVSFPQNIINVFYHYCRALSAHWGFFSVPRVFSTCVNLVSFVRTLWEFHIENNLFCS